MFAAAPDVLHRAGSLHVQSLTLWPGRGEVQVAGVPVSLTRREMELLLVLAKRPDRVVQRQDIYEAVWGGAMPHRDRSVDVWIKKLRDKLTAAAPQYQFIHTHYGFGYRLSAERV